ncbi:MAG: DASS family sodium-coupled anion symporter [Bacteroidota bacterium]|nr:DASS family sodium-coupled anion symporter [Bacteroidota bacterium]
MKRIGLLLGIIIFALILLMPTPAGMSPEAQKTLAIALLMAIWWITEAIPIPVTALIPIVLYPLLGVMSSKQSAYPYANHMIFLFMGGFLIALSMQKWNLHKRIALSIIDLVGTSQDRIILGFMIASAFLSMWISNTATTVMMVPIGMAVVTNLTQNSEMKNNKNSKFGISLMLGLAYSASVGGIGTLIGTPPNLVLANTLEKMYNQTIGFMEWFKIGIPIVIIMIPIIWLFLTKVMYPTTDKKDLENNENVIKDKLIELGKITRGEKIVLTVFVLTALSWIFRSTKHIGNFTIPGLDKLFPAISDATIAMFFAILLFVIPVNIKKKQFAMDWKNALKLPWGILILFGGGLSLAEGLKVSGLAEWIGLKVNLFTGVPDIVLILVVVFLIIFLTEMTSNTATTAMVLPILGSVAIGLGKLPMLLLAPATIAASCAFMLPVATPPNAIVFGSGYIKIHQMAKTGFFLNIISIFIITLLTYFVLIPFIIK